MLSYPIDEADELLTTKLAAAKQSLANCEEDLDFLREQITVGPKLKFFGFFPEISRIKADFNLDYGSCYSESVQLGCYDEAQREDRA